MEDLPKIPFIRERLSHLSENKLREAEEKMCELYEVVLEIYKDQKLTDKNKELE